jgi:hypothetical protein
MQRGSAMQFFAAAAIRRNLHSGLRPTAPAVTGADFEHEH